MLPSRPTCAGLQPYCLRTAWMIRGSICGEGNGMASGVMKRRWRAALAAFFMLAAATPAAAQVQHPPAPAQHGYLGTELSAAGDTGKQCRPRPLTGDRVGAPNAGLPAGKNAYCQARFSRCKKSRLVDARHACLLRSPPRPWPLSDLQGDNPKNGGSRWARQMRIAHFHKHEPGNWLASASPNG